MARDSLSCEPQLSLPKVIVPKPNGLTSKPDRPSVMYSFMCMAIFLPRLKVWRKRQVFIYHCHNGEFLKRAQADVHY
jgi:hypothetical protein